MNVELLMILSFFAFIVYICYSLIKEERKEKMRDKERKCISFQEGYDLTELPVITVICNDKKLNFILDTGANLSYINKESLNEKDVKVKINEEKSRTITAGGSIDNIHMVHLEFKYKDHVFSDNFVVQDFSSIFRELAQETGVKVHGLLGTSFFNKYKYVIDFSKYIAYYK